MPIDPKIHHRRSIRLPGYDYSQAGWYFLTICTYRHECILGKIEADKFHPTQFGEIVVSWLQPTQEHFSNILIPEWVIMPNHIHFILQIFGLLEPTPLVTKSKTELKSSLAKVISYYKYQTTKDINRNRNLPGTPFWQRNYYEHIIRDEKDHARIVDYIRTNPVRWSIDQLHP